jgi:PBSX family phage terminase large subunit
LDVLLGYSNCLLYGGARSGKTVLVIYFIVYCCLTFPGIRILVTRRYATDIRASIWSDSLPKVARLLGLVLGKEYKCNEQQMTVTFPNGSEIICGGLDDKERVDKILGTEYGMVYINESQDVPWTTVKTLRTRLAQKVEGFRNRFVCDLNPTSVNHWTYSLWFEGRMPDTEEPVKGTYGKIQMNPGDNKENLSENFIEEQLEGLTGEERKRFFLGEYSANSDLQVFHPVAVHDGLEADFLEWAKGKWHQMLVTGGLDFGFEDADAYVALAYVDGLPDVWVLDEYKVRKNDTTMLATDLKAMMAAMWEKYPFRAVARDDYVIWTDTGGLGRKTAEELRNAYELPVRAAYKRDKDVGLYFVQDDVDHGRLHLAKDGAFAEECRKAVWKRNKDTGKVERVLDDDVFHPDVLDAVIYAYRFLMKHGNEAMMGRAVESVKEPEAKGFFDMQAEVMRALNVEEAVW